jgi:hypothetical protein
LEAGVYLKYVTTAAFKFNLNNAQVHALLITAAEKAK